MENPTVSDKPVDIRVDRAVAQRYKLQNRHAHRLSRLMDEREDLRGVLPLADFVDEALRWTA